MSTGRLASGRLNAAVVLGLALCGGVLPAQGQEPSTQAKAASWETVGIGAVWDIYGAAVSPHDAQLMFVTTGWGYDARNRNLYRSIDGGKHWRMHDMREIRTIFNIVFHPTDANIIYGFGSDSSEIKVSRDKGLTWRSLVADAPWGKGAVIALVTDREDGNILLVGTKKGAYISNDGGSTFAACAGVTGSVGGFMVDMTTPTKSRTIFAGGSAGLWKSADGGKTWEKTAGLAGAVRKLRGGSNAKAEKSAVYCVTQQKEEAPKLWRSADKGETWTELTVTVNKVKVEGAHDFVCVADTDPDIIYDVFRDWRVKARMAKSTDGGKTWETCFRCEGGDRNVEGTWAALDIGWWWGEGGPGSLSASQANPDILMYSNYGELFITADGAKTWRQAVSEHVAGQAEPPAKGHRWASSGLEGSLAYRYYVDPNDKNHRYICYADLGFAMSEDGGRSWRRSVAGHPWPLPVTFYDIAFDPAKAGVIYAACGVEYDGGSVFYGAAMNKGGGVCVSTDNGATWKPINKGLPDKTSCASVAVDPKGEGDSRTLYAAMYDKGVYKSTDGGATWQEKSKGLGKSEGLCPLSIKLHASGTLFCLVGAGKTDPDGKPAAGLYRSSDGAETWELITSSQPMSKPKGFDVHPKDANIIYIAADGLFKTADSGKHWEKCAVDYPKAYGESVQVALPIINPYNPEIVYQATLTHGLWVSADAGKSWSEVKGFPPLTSTHVAWDPDDRNIVYVSTMGQGVWRGAAVRGPRGMPSSTSSPATANARLAGSCRGT